MRFQLALNVDDLEKAIEYYTRLLGAPVNKRKPGYANFAVDQPPIKLVLFENPGASERLNHVGFETFDNQDVEKTIARLEPLGLATKVIRDEHCCYARKSTVWAEDPQGLRWEFYKVQGDEETFGSSTAEPLEESPSPVCTTGTCGG